MILKTSRPHGPSRSRRSRLVRVGVVGLTAALLAACGGGSTGDDSAGDASADGLDDVIFLNSLPIESLSFSPELLADTGGYFEKEGLNVEFQLTKGSAQAIQTVIADKALVTRAGDIETILATGERDAPIVNVGTVQKYGTLRIVSSSSNPLTEASQFDGATVGLPSAGGVSETILDLVNASVGTESTATNKQVVGLAPSIFNLVESGRIDAYVVSLDTAIALEQQQPDAVIYDPNDDITAGAQLYLTSSAQAADPAKQDQLTRYLRAVDAAIKFMIKDEANGFEETMRLISSEYELPTLADPEVGEAALSGYVDSWTGAGEDKIATTVSETWTETYDELVNAGLVADGQEPDDWYTNDYAPGTH